MYGAAARRDRLQVFSETSADQRQLARSNVDSTEAPNPLNRKDLVTMNPSIGAPKSARRAGILPPVGFLPGTGLCAFLGVVTRVAALRAAALFGFWVVFIGA